MIQILDRIARHWFLFVVLFGGYCAAIAGVLGETYGFPNIFRDDPGLAEHHPIAFFVNGPTLLTQLSATWLIGMIWLLVGLLDHNPERQVYHASIGRHLKFLAPRVLIFSLFPLAAAYASIRVTGAPLLEGEIIRALLGTFIGCLMLTVFVLVSHLIAKISGARLIFVALALSILILLLISILPRLIPTIAIVWILGWFIVVYIVIGLIPEALRPIAIVALVGWVIFANGQPFKYKFDGIKNAQGKSYYDKSTLVKLLPANDQNNGQSTSSSNGLIDPLQSLRAWKARQNADDPKLVIIATSGGAYRAAFWTALVLDKLRKESAENGRLPGFTDSIRLITGASGGMVSASYFAATRTNNGEPSKSLREMLEDDIRARQKRSSSFWANWGDKRLGTRFPVARDSLSSIVQQLVQRDISHIFLPVQQDLDRGKVLQSHWKTLKKSFQSLKAGEVAGWRPSIILSPMIVETGQPLLISNLDLGDIRKVARKQIAYKPQEKALIQKRPRSINARKLKDAVEFFKRFPGAQKTFGLDTAVRMSASFAYITPAVELPTDPPQRVADAGYYDNYGINMAIAYLKQDRIRKWIQRNTSGVVIVQIRAYPSIAEEEGDEELLSAPINQPRTRRLRRAGKKRRKRDRSRKKIRCKSFRAVETIIGGSSKPEAAFHWLTGPFEGREMARQSSMLFRNSIELKLLQSIYPEDFLQTVVFENTSATSLNWNMPEKELTCLKRQIRRKHNREALKELVEFWRHEPEERPFGD